MEQGRDEPAEPPQLRQPEEELGRGRDGVEHGEVPPPRELGPLPPFLPEEGVKGEPTKVFDFVRLPFKNQHARVAVGFATAPKGEG